MKRALQYVPIVSMCGLTIAACHETPTAIDEPAQVAGELLGKGNGKGGPPSDCGSVPLRITFLAESEALQSDGGGEEGEYVEGADGGVHLNGSTGRLMFWTAQYGSPTRHVVVQTFDGEGNPAFSGTTTDRIYTNGHENGASPGELECGFHDIPSGSSSGYSAVLEVELDEAGIIRYGKTCDGDRDASSRVATSRSSDGLTWTVDGAGGVYCQPNGLRGNKAKLVAAGSAGRVLMELEISE